MQIKTPQVTFIKINQPKIHNKTPTSNLYLYCTNKNTTSNLYLYNMHK